MADRQAKRRLAAIVSADVAGYSRLLGEDETATLEAMKAHRQELWAPKIEEFDGRVVGTAGDSILVEFQSAVAAVECSVAVQHGMADRNVGLPEDRRMLLRMGINIGEVVVDGEDIFGDGVNVAARLEALAETGGICASDDVIRQIRGKLDLAFMDGGLKDVKNISVPIHVWHWSMEDAAPDNVGERETTLELPDKPSIAVLPFVNMSGDPEQEYFADGMTEDIITGLSRFRSLFVIARNSTFAYKGKSPDVREVAGELGVRYVLEGSVRRGGNRIRISGQLIDAESGNHLWAERYDRELDDIFAVQDEVTEAIVAAIGPEIGHLERKRAQRKPPESLKAWDIYQHGLSAFHSSTSEEGFKSAIEQFDRVNEIDPTFAPAFAMAAGSRTRYVAHFAPHDREAYLSVAREKAYRAITLDPRDPVCIWNDGRVHSLLGHHDIAISKVEEAIALNPSDAMSHHLLGVVLCTAGKANEAIPHFDQAMRLSPRDIFLPGMQTYRAFALFDLERYDEAFDWVQRARLSPHPRPLTFALLVAVLRKLGRQEEATAALNDLLAHVPGMSCSEYREVSFGRPEVMERFVDALREAGLPE